MTGRYLALAAATALFAFAVGFGETHSYVSQDGLTKLYFQGFSLKQSSDGDLTLVLTGGIHAVSGRQGLDVKSHSATTWLHQANKETVVRRLRAVGDVMMVKTVQVGGSTKRTNITGSLADYQAGSSQATVDLSGPVRIVDTSSDGRTLLDATGTSGKAVLSVAAKGDANPVKAATLHGPVTIHVVQSSKKQGMSGGQLVATGDELIYDHIGLPKITLRGHVVLKMEKGAMNGVFHLGNVVIHLNERGEETSIDMAGSN